MGTKLLIIGKGDNIITMILDNLYSNNIMPKVTVYNNLNLPIINSYHHDDFNTNTTSEVNMDEFDVYVLGVYQPKLKIKLVKELGLTTDKFINVIHDGLDISKMSTIGAGVLINSKVSIAAHTKIGNFVSINRHVSIGHHTTIGEGTTIGIGANIVDGIKIGKNTIIGAGSVVTKDIPDNVVAYGSPCKIIRDNQ